MDDLVKLIYFDFSTDKVHSHLFIPRELLHNGALFICENGDIYTVRYYDDKQNVAFALRRFDE